MIDLTKSVLHIPKDYLVGIVPGSDTGNGGNGSDGCASTGADVMPFNTSINGSYTMTLGSENMSNATGSVVLVRVALTSGQSISSIGIGVAS